VISNMVEYEKAEQELRDLERRLEGLQSSHPIGSKGFTKAGIRKMIARIPEELALYEVEAESGDVPEEIACGCCRGTVPRTGRSGAAEGRS